MSVMPAGLDPVDYIAQTKAAYDALGYPSYQWAHNPEPPPFVSLDKPLSECRVVLVASGGVYRRGQVAFTHKDDITHREIDTDVPVGELRVTHFAFDQSDARSDTGVVFPLAAIHRLAAAGVIGSVADKALTFMGGIYSQRRVRDELAPALVERVAELGADVALLVPV